MGNIISFLLCSGPGDHEDEASPRLVIVRSSRLRSLLLETCLLIDYTIGRSHGLPAQED
jgi:hypothetical protein